MAEAILIGALLRHEAVVSFDQYQSTQTVGILARQDLNDCS